MPGVRPLLAMGFLASCGITFEILSCTRPRGEGNFWPLLIYIFYFLLPLPFMFARQVMNKTAFGMTDNAGKTKDYAIFFASGIMVSSIALPIIMTRSPPEKPTIAPIACFYLELGNLCCLSTIALFCMYFKPI